MSSLIVLERHLSHLTMTEMKEADKVPFLHALVLAACLLNASRRLGSRLSCDTSSLSAPELRRLSRQIINGQPPRSPDVLKGQQEGAHALHDATLSRSAKDPAQDRLGSGTSEILLNSQAETASLATTGPPRKQPLLCLSPPAWCWVQRKVCSWILTGPL